jgi:ATP/maltotriose-dependent transcriptional regulator MalT
MPMSADWPLTGRDEELRVLIDLLAQPRSTVVLAGEAGVGKTRLQKDIAAALEEGGAVVRRAIATSTASSVPFGAFAHVLADLPRASTDRFTLLRQAIAALTALGDRVVVAVDDAHLLDDLSATLLQQLAFGEHATLVLTVRSDEVAPDAIVSLWKDGLAQRIELQPLSRRETEELIRSVLPGTVALQTTARLVEVSGGNPLFLREIVLGALDSGALHKEGEVWTWTIGATAGDRLREVVASRVAELAPAEHRALEVVALGEPLDRAVVEDVTPHDVLSSLERKGLVTEIISNDRHETRLVHPIYGEALRASIAPQDARAARAMLVEAHERVGVRDVLRMALWHLESGADGRPDLLREAAELPVVSVEPGLHERLARAAFEARPSPRTALSLGKALRNLSRFDEAIAVAQPMLASSTSDEEHARLADVVSFSLLFGRDGDEAVRVLREAQDNVADPVWRDWLRARRGNALFNWGRPQEALELSIGPADDQATDDVARIIDVGTATWVLAISGRSTDAIALSDRHMDTVLSYVDREPFLVGTAFAARLSALGLDGRVAEALTNANLVYQAAAERRNDNERMRAAAGLARLNILKGTARTALVYAQEATAYAEHLDSTDVVHWFVAMHAEALALLGEATSAQQITEKVPPDDLTNRRIYGPDSERASAWVHAALGEYTAARAAAAGAAASARKRGDMGWEMLGLLDAVRLGSSELAPDLLELCGKMQGALARAIGVFAEGVKDDDGAMLSKAGELFEAMGGLLMGAEAAALAAASYSRAGQRALAAGASARSRALADRCEGATTPILQAAGAPDPLTKREREVAILAARGLSNKEIADRLVTSVRTIEGHLYRIFAKLGVTARAELAGVLGSPEQAAPG